jgi:quinoprotein glucose dehydrogenase
LDASKGKLKWYFQTVHHNLWDYDLPAPPNLVIVKKHGKNIPAIAQVTKLGFIFVLNRITGKPIFPVKEKKVPASKMPKEKAWPTQPFPVNPKPFTRQGFKRKYITNITPEAHKSVVNKLKNIKLTKLFTPVTKNGIAVLPAMKGGAEWRRAAYDPNTHIIYVNSNTLPAKYSLENRKNIKKEEKNIENLYTQGMLFYTNNCASCHGADRAGGLYRRLFI